MNFFTFRGLLSAAGCAALVACGGGGGGTDTPAPSPMPGSGGPPSSAAQAPLAIRSLEIAQTHVLPEAGKRWTLANATESLHLTGGRAALALVRLGAADAASPVLEGLLNGASLGTVPLQPPAALPPTEAAGPAYGSGLYSADLPAAWLKPGLQLRARAGNYAAGETHVVDVGADIAMTLWTLPFYLFGADDTNSGLPLSQTGAPPADAVAEAWAKWPVAALTAANHPARRVSWPSLVIAPRTDSAGTPQPAYAITNSGQQKDGFAAMDSVLGIVRGIRAANGEGPLAVQYYAPLVMLDASGRYASPGGGLGGGDAGTGDHLYSGIFVHEQGHAFGLPHQGEAFDAGRYPYDWGSLKGSSWGYDANKREFLAPFVPATASTYAACASGSFAGHRRASDDAGRCVKQDPMQSGSGDQARGYRYATFSDYSAAMMQRNLEGKTVPDTAFPSDYKRWDAAGRRWVNVDTATTQGGIFGLDQNLPVARNVPVHTVVVTHSNAGTTGATRVQPPISYTGNRLRTIDPGSAADRASIVPDTGTYFWYCRNGGCDFTLRATYAGGTVRHVLLQGGYRPFNQASGTPPASANNARDGNSFRRWVVNLPADAALTRLELLATPMVWNGLPASPAVLAAWP